MKISNIKKVKNNTVFLFRMISKQKKGKQYIISKFFIAIFRVCVPLALMIAPGLIINELTTEKRVPYICLYLALIVGAPLIWNLINILFSERLQRKNNEITRALMYDFRLYVSEMDYSYLEDPDIQQLSERSEEVISDASKIIDIIGNIITSIISLFSIVVIISILNPLLLVLILLMSILNGCMIKWKDKKNFELRKEFSLYSRKSWGLTYMLQNFDYAKENRLYKVSSMLVEKIDETQRNIDDVTFKKIKTDNKVNLIVYLTNFFQTFVVYSYLIINVLKGLLRVGTMTIYLSAVSQFSSGISSVINAYLSLSEFCMKIEELEEFMGLLNKKNIGELSPVVSEKSCIEFKNVSFCYPGSEIYAIKNLNLKILCNEKLCIVGENGAGKSTFVKLLTRLYEPTSGEILLNGVNIKLYNYDEYQALFASVFQDCATYMFSIRENIILSKPYDKELFNRVCEESHISSLISKLKYGADTQIGKEIDPEGIEPSGGEEQRFAIARACYKGGEIFILDEPTAALDPNAEFEIYTQFRNMIRDKGAILITHRLSAVQLADKVAVFSDGQVIEYGTHRELYEKNGIYTKMFDKQAQFYRD